MKLVWATMRLRCVLGLMLIFTATAGHADVITDLDYDMSTLTDAELEVDWTRWSGGSSRVGIQINSTGNSLHYTNSTLDLSNNNAFLLDAVVSGSPLSADGSLGARMWVKFRQSAMPPSTFRFIEIRFVRQSGNCRIDLVDGTIGTIEASLDKDWTSLAPRYRVRLGHQQIGGTDYIIFQAEDPALWDSHGRLISPDATNSVSVPLTYFGIMPSTAEFGFGNVVAGNYYSEWEWVRIIHSDEAGTQLPVVDDSSSGSDGSGGSGGGSGCFMDSFVEKQ